MTKITKTLTGINEVMIVIDCLVILYTSCHADDWFKIDKPSLKNALETPFGWMTNDHFTFIVRECGFDSKQGLKGRNIEYLQNLHHSGIAVVGDLTRNENGFELKLNIK